MHKGKDEPELPDSYRDITLAAESGKIIQATVRPALNNVVENYTENTQYGSGLNDGTTEMVHLYTRACIDLARHKDLSLALIFIDVKTAFASMIRVLTMPFEAGQDLDKAYFERLCSLGFHDDEANEIVSEVCAEYDWSNAGGDD